VTLDQADADRSVGAIRHLHRRAWRNDNRAVRRPWPVGAVLLGAGTAMVYPTLLAAVGDVAHPNWRASSVGVYRLWRDRGFAVGALLAGVVADVLGLAAAIWAVAVLTALSGLVVVVRMYETHRRVAAGDAELPLSAA
jgi:MFS family permease